jgi:hypothetical protein
MQMRDGSAQADPAKAVAPSSATADVRSPADRTNAPAIETAKRRPPMIPSRTLPLLLVFLAAGALVLAFTLLTVHDRAPEEFPANLMAKRMHHSISFWIDHGLLRSGAVPAREAEDGSGRVYFHRSSTAGRLLGGYVVERIHVAFTGEYGWRALGWYNQLVLLLVAAVLALLAFRLATRAGAPPKQALLLSLSFQAVFFTFPDNLALFWGTTGREYWLLFVAIFLLVEERGPAHRTRATVRVQAASVFLLTYMEPVAGLGFIVSHAALVATLGGDRAALKRLTLICAVPALLALVLHRGQLLYAAAMFPSIAQEGSGFLFRTGLDGSTAYYVDHLDIAYRRDATLFGWKWLFLAGVAAWVGVLVAALRGAVERSGVIVLCSLLGPYLLVAAVFGQAVVNHPYLYDVMLFTPLVLVLLVVAPALVERMSRHRGITVALVLFAATWVSMAQLRQYAVRYPVVPEPIAAPAPASPSSAPDAP